jgi:hypothetical protein
MLRVVGRHTRRANVDDLAASSRARAPARIAKSMGVVGTLEGMLERAPRAVVRQHPGGRMTMLLWPSDRPIRR